MNNFESLFIRYIGQNSEMGIESDISLWELDRTIDTPWNTIMDTFKKFKKNGIIIGNHTKNGTVTLTSEGWKLFESEMGDTSVKVTPKKTEPVKTAPKARKPSALVSFDDKPAVKFNSTKTGDFKDSIEITIYGELTPTNREWVKKYENKIKFKTMEEHKAPI